MAEFGLIGAKLSHSYSQDIHNKLGYDYDLIECSIEKLSIVLLDEKYNGFNITVPYKEAIIPMLNVLDDSVKRIGACNTVIKRNGVLCGYNTDYFGLKGLIVGEGIDLYNKKVLILGSGGTAKTAMCVVEDLGGKYTLVSRHGEVNYENVYSKCKGVQVIINTTPYGMSPDINSLPIVDLTKLIKVEAVVDVIFNPFKTALITSAESLKIKAVSGLKMLVIQAIYAGQLFMNHTINADVDSITKWLYNKYCNISLIGMPGSGKTTIALALAKKLGRLAIDTDTVIEQENCKSCKEIIELFSEESFRKIESEVLKRQVCHRLAVVSTGGGAIKLAENRYYLKANSQIVYIDRRLDRLAQDGRPLSANAAAIAKLYNDRKDIYENLADITVKNNGNLSDIDSVVDEIIGGLGLEDYCN